MNHYSPTECAAFIAALRARLIAAPTAERDYLRRLIAAWEHWAAGLKGKQNEVVEEAE